MTKKLTPEQKAAKAAKHAAMPTGQETNPPGPRSRNSVTVACKLPHGLILRLFDHMDVGVPVLGGGLRMERKAYQVGESVTIAGNASPHGVAPKCAIVGGFALTPNVDAEFWAKWLSQNKDSDAVKSGLLFAHGTRDGVEGKAKEGRALKSGLERIDVSPGSKDPRLPKGVKTLTKADEEEAA